MNISKNRLKGFTLIEMLIVIAIIVVLMGISSLAIQGFRRNAQMETNNVKAQLVFSAFQDMVTQCEIKQDKSMFEPHYEHGGSSDINDDITGAVVFFRIADKDSQGNSYENQSVGLGDEIHIMCSHSGSVGGYGYAAPNVCSVSVWKSPTLNGGSGANSSADAGKAKWDAINTAIAGRLDDSMTGTYCVMIDLENYEVRSVICRDLVDGQDPKTGLYDPTEVGADGVALGSYITASTAVTPIDGSHMNLPCQMFFVENNTKQKDIYEQTGVIVGCYPYSDDMYSSIT